MRQLGKILMLARQVKNIVPIVRTVSDHLDANNPSPKGTPQKHLHPLLVFRIIHQHQMVFKGPILETRLPCALLEV